MGQLGYNYSSPNLIDGKEVWFLANLVSPRAQVTGGGGIVVDKNSTPPHLYIADTANNRILGFKDARAVGTNAHNLLTQTADLVIGQPIFIPPWPITPRIRQPPAIQLNPAAQD